MPRFDGFSLSKLEELKASVELAIKNRWLKIEGLDPRRFVEIHSELGCEITPVFIKIHKGGGAIHYDDVDPAFDYASDAFEYKDECKKHKVRSAGYKLLTPL